MNFLKYISLFLLLSIHLFANTQIEESIVKIYTVSKIPSYDTPWNSTIRRSSGSGAIIDGAMILTNAHVVANQTFIEVKRHGDTNRYEAKIEYISHQADLALLSVKDKNFFKGTNALSFGSLPNIQDKVAVYGFPMGGNSLSVSTGIVSRIEHTRYTHSGEIFLSIQIDAAVNPGSSGGPAISDGKIVGVVMQQIQNSQNLGYLIPVDVVEHFLEDVKDKKYDGYPHVGMSTEMMENETLRSVYKMDKDTTGVLIIDMSEKFAARHQLQKGDVITAIDSHKIENDGTVEFRHHQFTSYKYYIDKKQLGEDVTFDILRDGKKMRVAVSLLNVADDDLLVNTFAYDAMPKYFIYGGYVFTPLSRNLLVNTKSSLLRLREAAGEWVTKERDEAVVLLKVLASKANRGDHNFSYWMVDKVNYKAFKNFEEFLEIVKNFDGKYLILENEDGVKIAIDTDEAKATQEELLKRYSIKSAQKF